jgi:hypothetical protein
VFHVTYITPHGTISRHLKTGNHTGDAMDIKDLQQYPLASLYGWRASLFVTPQGVSDEAAERREIQKRVFFEAYAARMADFSDIL